MRANYPMVINHPTHAQLSLYHRLTRLSTLFFVSSVFYWLSAWFAPVFVPSALPLDLSTRVLNPALARTLPWYPSPITTLDLIRASLYQHHHPSIAYEP